MEHKIKEQWDNRYSADDYIYGIEPNSYFKSIIDSLKPGSLLLPGEGEGRNAVYAASKGWKVTAYDISTEGRKKAMALAKANNVEIEYLTGSLSEIDFGVKTFDCIALVFVHLFREEQKDLSKKLISYLKPGGVLISEAFSRKQINNNSGGPKNEEMLYTCSILEEDFGMLDVIELYETETVLNEGPLHQGKASVVRFHAIAPTLHT